MISRHIVIFALAFWALLPGCGATGQALCESIPLEADIGAYATKRETSSITASASSGFAPTVKGPARDIACCQSSNTRPCGALDCSAPVVADGKGYVVANADYEYGDGWVSAASGRWAAR